MRIVLEAQEKDPRLLVRFPYRPDLVEKAKALGGQWDPEEKAWAFHTAHTPRLRGLVGEALEETLREFAEKVAWGRQALEKTKGLLLPTQQEDLRHLWTAFLRSLKDPKAPKGFLLALGTGTGKTYVYAAFLRAAEAMGLEGVVVVPNEDLARQTGKVLEGFGVRARLTTYGRLDPEEARGKLLVLDEAHLAKGGWSTDRGTRAWKAAERALFTLYASATPFDRPWETGYLLLPTGVAGRRMGDLEGFLRPFGVRVRERPGGGKEYYFTGGVEGLVAFHRTLEARRFLRKRVLIPPEGLVDHEVTFLDLPRKERDLVAEVRRRLRQAADTAPSHLRGAVMGQRTLLTRALLERIKLRAAFPLLEGLLTEGWHVALFLQYRGERELDLSTKEGLEALLEERGGEVRELLLRALRGLHLRLPSPLSLVEERFGWLGEGLAFYTGRESEAALRQARASWEEGRVRLLVLTGGKGGTGLSLHDTRGGRPTAQVVLTLPWTGSQLDQILGRTVRVGLASRVRFLFPVARVPAERHLGKVLAASLHTLGYAVRGGAPVVPEKVVQAFLYGLAEVDPEGFQLLVEEGGEE
ncbi:MAG: DEAD/DEAH box helicase family protein [Thermus sp.]